MRLLAQQSSVPAILILAITITSGEAFGATELPSTGTNIDTPNLKDPCYAPTQPLTIQLRKAFVEEIKMLAIKAEKDHGVPAAIISAMAINESGYGTTKLANAANNILSYKWRSNIGPNGRTVYKLACQDERDSGNTYVAFKDRADSVNFVASKLATSVYYKNSTIAYRKALADKVDRKSAAIAWLKSIAPTYNPYDTEKYIATIIKIADDPIEQSGHLSKSDNLWDLSFTPNQESLVYAARVAAVVKAQKAAYVIQGPKSNCQTPTVDILGWPSALIRECVYSVGSKPNELTGYAIVLDVKPETIATWIESACSKLIPNSNNCYSTVLSCGKLNSGMMFPVSGNIMENMGKGPWKNYFFRNGMTVSIWGQKNGASEQVPLDRQKELALMPDSEIVKIPTGVTRFWRTLPQQFAARFTSEAIPKNTLTVENRNNWLSTTKSEILAALEKPDNRLLEAWIAAHTKTLATGACPSDDQP